MDTKVEITLPEDRPIVYVRPIAVADLPEEVRAHAGGIETVYAVHSAEGERLALARDRRMAFQFALENNLAPVHVH